MTPEQFAAACMILWGNAHSGGVAGAAEFLGVSERNIRRFQSGEKAVGPGLAGALTAELARRLADTADNTPSLAVVRRALAA